MHSIKNKFLFKKPKLPTVKCIELKFIGMLLNTKKKKKQEKLVKNKILETQL